LRRAQRLLAATAGAGLLTTALNTGAHAVPAPGFDFDPAKLQDAYFPMACLNAAGSCLDGIITPYHATTLVCGVGYFEPDEERDLLTAMRALRTSYEDQPDDRAGLDEQITRRLQAWLQATDRFPGPPA
jgi:hypothetical protein